MSAEWTYANNTQSFDTIGGRVVQLLSVTITDMTVQGVAGSRQELQRFTNNIMKIMKFHVATQLPVQFRVPSRKWDFMVYVKAMPQVGWDVTTVSYPFQLTLGISEDVSGIKSRAITTFELDHLKKTIGYNSSYHGGDPNAFTNIVSALDLTPPGQTSSGGTGAPGTVGNLGQTIVDAAKSQLGVPYKFGTEDPKGIGTGKQGGREHDTSGANFDCSGLTQWCYAQAGIAIPGTAASQQSFLSLHPKKTQLQIADLVFFWYPNSRGIPSSQASHVGIYTGNGKMIDAPHTGSVVREEAVNWSAYIGAGRSPQVYQSGGGTSISGYANPFPSGFTSGRIDQGVDLGGSGNIYAIGNATVDIVIPSNGGWNNGACGNATASLIYTLKDGPAAGKSIYVTECISIKVSQGATITAGQLVATMGSGVSLETGWAIPHGNQALAHDPTQWSRYGYQIPPGTSCPGYCACSSPGPGQVADGTPMALGQNFSQFLQKLGSPPGGTSQSVAGCLPVGWPTW